MTSIDILISAIQQNRTVTLTYEGDESPRHVDPHVIYESTGKILLDGYQISGPSSTQGRWNWKQFNIQKTSNIHFHDAVGKIREGYNPDSDRYAKAKVKR